MTKNMLILARGEYESYFKLDGSTVFDNLLCKGVLLTDRGSASKLAKLTDKFKVEVIRWSDKDDIYNLVQQLHQEYQFDAVATLDESNVGFAAELRQLLDIQGLKPEQAMYFRDKVAMKQKLKSTSVAIPDYVSCHDLAAVEQLFDKYKKLVIKPKDGFGSKKVEIVSEKAELEAWLQANSKELELFEAEQFIDGQLFHVNALIIDGKTVLTAPAAYLPGMSNIDFTAGTPFISVIEEDPELSKRLIEFSNSVNQAFGIVNGVTHLECFVSPDGAITFCEIGLRPGGGGIVWMIEAQYGVNYAEAVYALESGCSHVLPEIKPNGSDISGLIGIRSNISGFVTKCLPIDTFTDPRIKLKQSFIQEGAFKAASAHCTDFVSLFVFDSNNTEEFHSMWHQIQQKYQENFSLSVI